MRLLFLITFIFGIAAIGAAAASVSGVEDLEEMSLSELEDFSTSLEQELDGLAQITLRGGVGEVGYRSKSYLTADINLSLQLDLQSKQSISEVVLVPSLWRDTREGVRSEGFPIAFRVLVGVGDESTEVARFDAEDALLPRIAPLVVSFSPREAQWVRIEVSEMSPLISEKKYIVQLSEILVFSGEENVALHHEVTATTDQKNEVVSSLTDGFTPYLIDAAHGLRSQTRVLRVVESPPLPTLTIDLGDEYPVSQINLHAAHTALSIPMKTLETHSVPKKVRVTGASHADFSDAVFLCEYHQESLLDSGPVMMQRFAERRCRYIRFIIVDYKPIVSIGETTKGVAFSEIEVLSKGKNVALGAKITPSKNLIAMGEGVERITDGHNYYGTILPEKVWINQLARRHELELIQPTVIAELGLRYTRQKRYLNLAIWAAVILAFVGGFGFMIVRYLHLRELGQFKERFAADLHDELGANLHTIGLLSDLAEAAHESPEELSVYLRRIRAMTERSGLAVQHVTTLNESSELFTELVPDMQRSAERILTQLEHDFSVEGEEFLSSLKPRTSVDLFLFYKECLVNTCRHSDATKLMTRLTATPGSVTLHIEDNGKGVDQGRGVPKSLRRRARVMRAKLKFESNKDGGTVIDLTLANGKRLKK